VGHSHAYYQRGAFFASATIYSITKSSASSIKLGCLEGKAQTLATMWISLQGGIFGLELGKKKDNQISCPS